MGFIAMYHKFTKILKKTRKNPSSDYNDCLNRPILAVKLKMINQDRMIFGDFSVNFEPISLKF